MEISSVGGLPERITKEDFLGGFSAPKNKELMRVFKDVGLVEQLGTGVRRILKSYPSEIFAFYPNFIRVTFIYRENTLSLASKSSIALSTTSNLKKGVNKIKDNIIGLVAQNVNITQEEIASKLEISKRTVVRHMKELVELKMLKRVGDNRTGYWEVL